MFRGIVNDVAKKLGIKWALAQIRAAADGKYGPKWRAAYWWAAGKKRISSAIFGMVAAVLAVEGYDQAAIGFGILAGVLLEAGLLDGAWRTDIPAWLRESGWYRFLAANSAGLTTALATAWAALEQSGDAHAALWGRLLLGVGAVLGQLGLVDAAWRARPPVAPLDR